MRSASTSSPLAARTASAKRVAQTCSKSSAAAVEPGSSASATASRSASESRPLTAPSSRTKAAATSGDELLELEDGDAAVRVLGDHREVDDAHEALLDELGEGGGDLAGEAVAGEVDHDVLDGSDARARSWRVSVALPEPG